MKIVCCNDYKEMSRVGAGMVAEIVKSKPACVLGLATGSTPEGLYAELIAKYQRGELDFSGVTTVNLDEYYPTSPENEQSYRYFMNTKLFDHVNVDKANTYVPNGSAEDAAAEAARYEAFVRSLGGADIQILGIGRNGHIAFNEPADAFTGESFKIALTQSTIDANSIYFDDIPMPRYAMTMGIGSIMKAKKIVLIATDASKAEAVKGMIKGEVTPQLPASILQQHQDVVIFLDEAAASLL